MWRLKNESINIFVTQCICQWKLRDKYAGCSLSNLRKHFIFSLSEEFTDLHLKFEKMDNKWKFTDTNKLIKPARDYLCRNKIFHEHNKTKKNDTKIPRTPETPILSKLTHMERQNRIFKIFLKWCF